MLGKRVLISGASGFVGANLARRALRDGHEVHLVLRPGHQSWRIDEIAANVHLHAAVLQDRDLVEKIVQIVKPDWIFHLAAYGAYSTQKGFEQMVQTNVLGCASLLDACTAAGFEAFVNCGSSSEYGLKDHAPKEDEPIEPNSHYALTKAAATHYCNLVSGTHGTRVFTLRLYSIYGPYEEPSRLIPTLLLHALDGRWPPLVSPRTARDYVFVEDACDAIISVANSSGLASGIYNVCTGVQTSLEDVVSETSAMLNVGSEPEWGTLPQRSWDSDIWVGSPAKLREQSGWRARTNLQKGLRQTVEWFRTNPKWMRYYADRIFPAGVSP
jgi:nucleoside-diphosphate-sugar epimerase